MATARATKSGNPATSAAARKAEREAKAAEALAKKEAAEKAAEAFKNYQLPELVLDEDGYEVIPDKTALEGGTYKFKVAGKAWSLPNLQYLPIGIAQMLGTAAENQAVNMMFDRYAPGLMDELSADQLMHVVARWRNFSVGVGLGE